MPRGAYGLSSSPFPLMENTRFDLVVIGSGPAGQKAAICAAKLHKRVAVVEKKRSIGGVCVNTGTIPSKPLREAVIYLSGLRQRAFYGRGYAVKENISMNDLVFRADAVMVREIEEIKAQLRRNQVTVVEGTARFIDPHSVRSAVVASTGRARHRRARRRDYPHWPSRHGPARHHRVFPRHHFQLSHHGRSLQGRRPRRPQQALTRPGTATGAPPPIGSATARRWGRDAGRRAGTSPARGTATEWSTRSSRRPLPARAADSSSS
jgi:hypothetical protein